MTSVDFEFLLTRHTDFLHPYAISLTNNYEEARDLYQETMLRALINRDKYHFGTNLKAWLYTLMRNIFINNYRRSKKFTSITQDALPETWMGDKTTAANSGWSNLRMKEINEALHKLPDMLRITFELYFTGYKYQEIATLLDEPLGTVKSRIHFARKMLVAQTER